MVPARFLKKYDNIIIELDGTLTGDKYLYTCAMLSVYELCNSNKYFGKSDIDYTAVYHNQTQIADLLLCGDKIRTILSELGIDNPIDTAYALLCVILGIGERRDFTNIYNYFKYIDMHTPQIFDHLSQLLSRSLQKRDCKPGGEIYELIKKCYNEWLFGDELYEIIFREPSSLKGKKSMLSNEVLLMPFNTVRDILSALINGKKKLFLYSLRTKYEVNYILNKYKLEDFFTSENILTFDDIVDSGHTPNTNTPNDPDPFCFARLVAGNCYADSDFAEGTYDSALQKTIVISNSTISLFSAQSAGVAFAAIANEKPLKNLFRQLETDYVIDSVNELIV